MIPPLQALFSNPVPIKKSGKDYFTGTLLALDPGETTGYAFFEFVHGQAPVLVEYGQLKTKTPEAADEEYDKLFSRVQPEHVVLENYRVYGHKAQMHANNEMITSQNIGILKVIISKRKLNYDMQMASQAKGFCDDDKLRAWGVWHRGAKHARDATRHGIYWGLFTWFNSTTFGTIKNGESNG